MNAHFGRRALGLALLLGLATACATSNPRRSGSSAAPEGSGALSKSGEAVRREDRNGDGKTDVWRYDTGEGEARRTVRKELDLDRDGRVDVRTHHAADGSLEREEFDLDFDGRIDLVNFFAYGERVRSELDRNGDGRTDVWKHFRKGRLTRVERDEDGDGKPELLEFWEGDELDRIGEDLNGDGQVDRWLKKSGS